MIYKNPAFKSIGIRSFVRSLACSLAPNAKCEASMTDFRGNNICHSNFMFYM